MDELNILDQQNCRQSKQGEFRLEKKFKKWQEIERLKTASQKESIF